MATKYVKELELMYTQLKNGSKQTKQRSKMATKYVKEFELIHAQLKKQFKID